MKNAALLLLALTGLLAACSHHADDPAPDPAPTLAYTRQLSFAPPRPILSAAYTTPQLDAWAETTTTTLRLRLGAKSREAVVLEVPLATLAARWVGTYALRCPARPTDPAAVTYVYYPTPNSWSTSDLALINNCAPLPLVGSFTITAYDADRHLLSGRYTVQAGHQIDPIDATSFEYCDLVLGGEFTSLKVNL